MRELSYTIPEKYNNWSIERVMKDELGLSSRLFVRLKHSGKLKKNGLMCRSIDTVNTGDVVTATIGDDSERDIPPWDYPLDILYEDNDIVVVNKPVGVAVYPSVSNHINTLANAMTHHWHLKNERHIFRAANRLDKGTSGLCIIAKNQYAHFKLSTQLKNKTFKRRYRAICHGIVKPSKGIIELPIAREIGTIIKRKVSPEGKEAITEYDVIKYINNELSYLELELQTGRTHQIRVHFSHIGHPLIGDWLYGKEEDILSHQALHAYFMSFNHPVTNEKMEFNASLPNDMKQILIN